VTKNNIFTRSDFLNNSINIARMIISHKISTGDKVVDATAGNGHDTLFLAEQVGDKGQVFAFDISENAINNTKQIIEKHNLSKTVTVIKDSHCNIANYINFEPNLILFNLGYLPGNDKNHTTKTVSTIEAIEKSLNLIAKLGLVLIVVYSGHHEGKSEKNAIEEFTKTLNQKLFNVIHIYYPNQLKNPPEIFAIEKR